MKFSWVLCAFYGFIIIVEGKILTKKVFRIFSVSNFTENEINRIANILSNKAKGGRYLIDDHHIYTHEYLLSSLAPDNITPAPLLNAYSEDFYRNLLAQYSITGLHTASLTSLFNILKTLSDYDDFIWYIDSEPTDAHLLPDILHLIVTKKIPFDIKPIGDYDFSRSPVYSSLAMACEFYDLKLQHERKRIAISKYEKLLESSNVLQLLESRQQEKDTIANVYNKMIEKFLELCESSMESCKNHVELCTSTKTDVTLLKTKKEEREIGMRNYEKWLKFLRESQPKKNLATFVYEIVNATEHDLIDVSYAMKIRFDLEQNLSPHLQTNFSLVVSSELDSIQTIDASKQYTVEDFQKIIEPFNTITPENIAPLRGLHKALEITPPNSEIVFITNIHPKENYELIPEILNEMIDKQIQVIINKIDSPSDALPGAYDVINEVYQRSIKSFY